MSRLSRPRVLPLRCESWLARGSPPPASLPSPCSCIARQRAPRTPWTSRLLRSSNGTQTPSVAQQDGGLEARACGAFSAGATAARVLRWLELLSAPPRRLAPQVLSSAFIAAACKRAPELPGHCKRTNPPLSASLLSCGLSRLSRSGACADSLQPWHAPHSTPHSTCAASTAFFKVCPTLLVEDTGRAQGTGPPKRQAHRYLVTLLLRH